MKLQRLLAILSLLCERGKATAQELADRFEVSKRTILRDIETLNQAGVPIITRAGRDGGIALMPHYTLDRRILSTTDKQHLASALTGLQSVARQSSITTLHAKLLPEDDQSAMPMYAINFAPWAAEHPVQHKIEQLQQAIEEQYCMQMRYIGYDGQTERVIEPHQLVFRQASWYVWAFCQLRQDFRLFKLQRIIHLSPQEESFSPRPYPDASTGDDYSSSVVFSRQPIAGYTRVELHYAAHDALAVAEVLDGSFLDVDHSHITFYTPQLAIACEAICHLPPSVIVDEPAKLRAMVAQRRSAG